MVILPLNVPLIPREPHITTNLTKRPVFEGEVQVSYKSNFKWTDNTKY